MKNTQAVLVVSFGTSHLDTLQKNIAAIEQTIAEALPQFALRRAFTSSMILKKLQNEEHLQIDTVVQALCRLEEEGYTHVVIQPTHVLHGEEYSKLCREAAPFSQRLSIFMGTPLLTSKQDYDRIARAIATEIPPPASDEAIVFMGHGTAHHGSAVYAQLESILHDLGWNRAFIGTMNGDSPLPQVIDQLKKSPQIHRVRLYPLMVVAGRHAEKDMASPQKDSWCSQLQAQGYEVSCVLRGLGEYASIRALFAQHAQCALPLV